MKPVGEPRNRRNRRKLASMMKQTNREFLQIGRIVLEEKIKSGPFLDRFEIGLGAFAL